MREQWVGVKSGVDEYDSSLTASISLQIDDVAIIISNSVLASYVILYNHKNASFARLLVLLDRVKKE